MVGLPATYRSFLGNLIANAAFNVANQGMFPYNCRVMLRFVSSFAFAAVVAACGFAQGWQCYGGDAQHSGQFVGTSQTANLVKWQTSLDQNRAYYGNEVLVHYAAPTVTQMNTVVYGYSFTSTVNGSPSYDNWRVIGRKGTTGAQVWSMDTDYSAAVIYPNDWTSVFPMTLYKMSSGATTRGVVAAGAAGSILIRPDADSASSASNRVVFYTTLSDFNKNKATYAPIKINTPISADNAGNLFFGYEVISTVPFTSVGSGGIVKVNAKTGAVTFKSVSDLKIDGSLSRPAMNAAPAVTADGKFIYVALVGGSATLAKLNTSDLSVVAKVQVMDPSVNGSASFINESSASPMIGPDGQVFMGVFGNQWRESHGWMMQFDSNLNPKDAAGKKFPTGAFGWDDTASIVPATMVPSYKGKAKYLLLTKYNNYDMGGDAGADGSNKVAVLDPTSDSISKDRQSGIAVMNEVLTVLGPTLTGDPNHPAAVNEWCINSAAVDVNRKSAIINSEDGHMYRWSFVTNSLVENIPLQPATGEAYTETAIGPDGQLYVINNSILFAIGSNNATAVSTVQGAGVSGTVKNVWSLDGQSYSVGSVNTSSGQTATVEADFTLTTANPTSLTYAGNVAAGKGATGSMYAYNYTTKKFDLLGSGTIGGLDSHFSNTISSNVGRYIGTGGKVRLRLTALVPPTVSKTKFTFVIDTITCGLN